LRFEDICACLKDVDSVVVGSDLVSIMIGHLPFLATQQLHFQVFTFLYSLAFRFFELIRKLLKPCKFLATALLYLFDLDPLLLRKKVEPSELDIRNLCKLEFTS